MRRFICLAFGVAVMAAGGGCGTKEEVVPQTPEQKQSVQDGMKKYEVKKKS